MLIKQSEGGASVCFGIFFSETANRQTKVGVEEGGGKPGLGGERCLVIRAVF